MHVVHNLIQKKCRNAFLSKRNHNFEKYLLSGIHGLREINISLAGSNFCMASEAFAKAPIRNSNSSTDNNSISSIFSFILPSEDIYNFKTIFIINAAGRNCNSRKIRL